MENAATYLVRRLGEVEEVRSTCGFRKALFTAADGGACSVSVLRISDARAHFHRKTTEVYYVLEGEGMLELDGEAVPLSPGVAVLIHPGVRHAAKGGVTALIVGVPPFEEDDMFFDE